MHEEEPTAAGLPGWVMTFADLMTLLMCFFVLMLSFSEMDVAKFKEMAGSMKDAFGVQVDLAVKDMPKGTSIIAREFSPARPEPTPLDSIRQFTVQSNMNTLDVGMSARLLELDRREEEARRLAERLIRQLADEIAAGTLLVRVENAHVIVQILEKDSFASGDAEIEAGFVATLSKIGTVLSAVPGAIIVSGHTDDVPISTGRFRSNWDLSAARAASVAHALLGAGVEPARIMVSGHADTQPRMPNDSSENRAKNRRIDITITSGRERHSPWSEDPLALTQVPPRNP